MNIQIVQTQLANRRTQASVPGIGLKKTYIAKQKLSTKVQQKEEVSQYLNSTWDKISVDDIDAWNESGPPTPLLDTVNFPKHIKNFSLEQLQQLCKELRQDVVHNVSLTGGHLGASLGVVELTVALHHIYDAPEDRIIWDVGHQAYIHKMLTGRRKFMSTIRQTGGLSGFTNRVESEYDPFGTGHSSTSISAGLGMAAGRDVLGKKNHVIAIIGDGAITGGMAYEAMNNAGFLDKNMVIILNDNQQVSLPTQYNGKNQAPVGGLSSALSKIQSNRDLREIREKIKGFSKQFPVPIQNLTSKVDEYGRGVFSGKPSTLFEELGLYYIGPVDGHNLDDLLYIIKEVKETNTQGPVLIHCITRKGNGYLPAAGAEDRMHGVAKYDYKTGKQVKGAPPKTQSYTNYFADALAAEAEADDKVVAIHAAMAGGTGLYRFDKKFPEKVWDVGIAEQHAVTYAAGMACEGLKPTCAIYSTFLQRGYDQIVHDVCLQNLPVRFAMDRAGMVGADGGTHQGSYDIAYMACLPNMVVMAPSNEAELINMIATSIDYDEGASCYRYPRGSGIGVDLEKEGIVGMKGKALPIGKGIVRQGGKDVCLLGYGTMVNHCMAAAQILSKQGISATVVDARFCKPLDHQLIRQIAKDHPAIISVEEGSPGGFGSHVMHFMALDGLLDGNLKFRPMTLPDRFIDHGTQPDQWQEAGLNPNQIARTAAKVIGKKIEQFSV